MGKTSLNSLFSSQGISSPEREIVGADGGGGTPVPIPNTAVKPTCAQDTWLEAAWENRQVPTPSIPPQNLIILWGFFYALFPLPTLSYTIDLLAT